MVRGQCYTVSKRLGFANRLLLKVRHYTILISDSKIVFPFSQPDWFFNPYVRIRQKYLKLSTNRRLVFLAPRILIIKKIILVGIIF